MARFEIADVEGAAFNIHAGGDVFFDLGMMYATGGSGPADLVTAHKWFNIAALKGSAEAARLRRELSAEMSDSEIAAAQRAARAWLNSGEPKVEHRAAA
jgi:TPR repeat protein